MDNLRGVRKPAVLTRGAFVSSVKKMMSLDTPSLSKSMKLTKINRGAIIALLNCTLHSEWISIPTDQCGCGFLFSRKKAATIFGKTIKTADLFSINGNASRLATEIIWIATVHGWIAHSAGNTCCPHMVKAFEALALSDAGMDFSIKKA